MQQQVTTNVSTTRKLVVYCACCLLVMALWWASSGLRPVSSEPAQDLSVAGAQFVENLPATLPVIAGDGVTVYGGTYTVILMPIRFVLNHDGQTMTLAIDLKYSNDSPFVVEIAPSNQIHASVFDDSGALVGTFVANQGTLQPGSIETVTMDLGKDYSLQRDSGRRFLVLLSDAGSNFHGQSAVEMSKF